MTMVTSGDLTCNEDRKLAGLAYPRTCAQCGLGPCRVRPAKVRIDPVEFKAAVAAHEEPITQFFAYAHLPVDLQAVSARFYDLAQHIITTLPRNPERGVALRKLLEAKDAAVRARLFQ